MSLLSCPFCGAVPKMQEISGSYGYYPPSVGIKCCIVSFSFPTEEWAQGRGHYSVRKEAIEKLEAKWNTRHDGAYS